MDDEKLPGDLIKLPDDLSDADFEEIKKQIKEHFCSGQKIAIIRPEDNGVVLDPDSIICQTCIDIHGRDTKTPIMCPVCHEIVGCFYHNRNTLHIRNCERKRRGLPPIEPLWDDEDD